MYYRKKKRKGKIMKWTVSLVILVLLLPAVYAVEYSYDFGNGASSSAGSYDIGGAATVSLQGNPLESSASNHIFAYGPISTSRSANSGNGLAHATSSFSVTGPGARTMYEFSSSANTNYATTSESLTSWNADTINALAHGWNSNGDDAQASILVTSPTDDRAELLDYSNYASAYQGATTYASASQRCYSANVWDPTYGRIYTSLYGKEGGTDYSKVELNLPYGTINNPYPSSPLYSAAAYGSRTDNSGNGRTYAQQSTNAYGSNYVSATGYFFARSTAHRYGYTDIQDYDTFPTGTHTITSSATTTYPSASALNTHNV
jgi:hypothetical protein